MTIRTLTRRAACGLLSLAALGAAAPAFAQAFPAKPIRIVVGFAPGGGVDAQARLIADALQRKYGQPVTVENKPGAGGRLAAETAARAEPDGYTIGTITGADALLAVVDPKLGYKLPGDFRLLTMVSDYPFAIVTAADSPYKSFTEFLQAAKKSGAVSSASAGIGTTHHLAAELISAMADVDILHIPYKGSSSANADVISGRVSVQFAASPQVLSSGKLRALAITSPKRARLWPNVPAVAEFVPGYEVTSWLGLVVPAKTPAAVAAKLAADVQEVLKARESQQKMETMGFEVVTSTPAELQARVEADMVKWQKLITSRNIKVNE
ncbi:MAG TPA: tripartite tricarboxylate transporter substrate-binding protein [Ramlibacter sp.]|nr:tripartite tricarboxylate transporter substrate-binding protein [Ramlibacter sp.]